MGSEVQVTRARGLRGALRPPSDKSLTHRALIFAAGAGLGARRGAETSVITHPLQGEDCLATAEILGALGAEIEFFPAAGEQPPMAIVQSYGRPDAPDLPLDCGNSGTAMRLLAGWLAGHDGLEAVLTGDPSLARRPMGRVVGPLRQMGASIEGETAPLRLRGRHLSSIRYESPIASAQVKSAILLAGLQAGGTTFVSEPSLSRDHTERMIEGLLGLQLLREGELCVGVPGGQRWSGFHFDVPGDISSAAFWMVGAAILPESDLVLKDVGLNPTRSGVLHALERAGAKLRIEERGEDGGEPVGDIFIEGGAALQAFEVGGAEVPTLLDEIPVLAVLATQCEGVTTFRDVGELRVKESDRIESTVALIQAMGGRAESLEDGFRVHGPTKLTGGTVDAGLDHRTAMATAIAGLVASDETTVTGAETVASSYPGFEDDLRSIVVR